MKVITVATQQPKKKGYIRVLVESCERLGYELVILGQNEVQWKGFGWSIQLIMDYIRKYLMESKELFIVVDAYNTIMLQGPDETLRIYRDKLHSPPFIFGTHRHLIREKDDDNIKQDVKVLQRHFTKKIRSPGEYRYEFCPPYTAFCGRTWMTTPQVAVKIWDSIDLPDDLDDRKLLIQLIYQEDYPIEPDYKFDLFATLVPKSKLSLKQARLCKNKNIDAIKIDKATKRLYITNDMNTPVLLCAFDDYNIDNLLLELGVK